MQLDEIKLEELYNKIRSKQNELLKEIHKALEDGLAESEIEHLKSLQLQCAAEVRLLKYLKNDMKGDFVIC